MKKCLTLMTVCGILCKSSGSVGMADELDSGSSARKGVWVQVPSSAYDKKKVSGFCLRLFFLQSEAFLEPRVQSTLRFGRRRTEVPRTSCAPSSAKSFLTSGFNLRYASVGEELSYLFQEVNRDCRSALFFAFYVKC